MLYLSGQAFRQALEVRLRSQSLQTHVPLSRLRKLISFERFLARLALYQPGQWLLKGGLALEWRIGSVARSTKDVDVLSLQPLEDARQAIVNAVSHDLDDYFRFVVQHSSDSAGARVGLGLRLQMQAWLDGRLFESFHLDVGWGDPVVDPPQVLSAPPLLQFAGIAPASVLVYPITQHVAEKVHAYLQVHQGGEGSRVKDLVDMLLIARFLRLPLLGVCPSTGSPQRSALVTSTSRRVSYKRAPSWILCCATRSSVCGIQPSRCGSSRCPSPSSPRPLYRTARSNGASRRTR